MTVSGRPTSRTETPTCTLSSAVDHGRLRHREQQYPAVPIGVGVHVHDLDPAERSYREGYLPARPVGLSSREVAIILVHVHVLVLDPAR